MANKNLKTKKVKKKKAKSIPKKVEEELYNKERVEKDKRLIMWSGVTFFMALILTLWFFNIRTVFTNVENEENNTDFEWKKMTEELSQSIISFKESWSEVKKESENIDTNNASSTELSKEDIKELKNKIEKLETKLNNGENN